MDLNFVEPYDAPVPPEEVKIKELQVDPLPDQRRVKIRIELTPFQARPTLVVVILDNEELQLAATTIIETVDHILEFTMHLRGRAPAGSYKVRAAAGYEEGTEPVHVLETGFELTG